MTVDCFLLNTSATSRVTVTIEVIIINDGNSGTVGVGAGGLLDVGLAVGDEVGVLVGVGVGDAVGMGVGVGEVVTVNWSCVDS